VTHFANITQICNPPSSRFPLLTQFTLSRDQLSSFPPENLKDVAINAYDDCFLLCLFAINNINPNGGNKMSAEVIAVCISENKGERKTPVASVELREEHGIVGDAHAGEWHRQVSLLALESIEKMQRMGLDVDTGDFAENITTKGIDLPSLPIGTRLTVGDVLIEITQIGKECHTRCAIYHQAGDCVMPKEGIFARVLHGGVVKPGDRIEVVLEG
jgi:MOSC domain-containing protein YiiM